MKTPRYRPLLAVVVVLALALVAGCGGSSADPKKVLSEAHFPSSGTMTATLETVATQSGSDQQGKIQISGPFQSSGRGKLPSFRWEIASGASGASAAVNATVTSTGTNAYLGFQGANYELGGTDAGRVNKVLAQLVALNPKGWLASPSAKDDESVNGADSNHIQANLDGGALIRSLAGASANAGGALGAQIAAREKQFKESFKDAKVDLWAAKDDHSVRRLQMNVKFTVPPSQAQLFSGLSGGAVKVSVDFTNVGQPAKIAAPANAKPLSDLTSQLGGGGTSGGGTSGGGTGGTGGTSPPSAAGGGGSGSGPSAKAFQRFSKCLEQANPSDKAAVAKCQNLLK